jgi:alpha-amylase
MPGTVLVRQSITDLLRLSTTGNTITPAAQSPTGPNQTRVEDCWLRDNVVAPHDLDTRRTDAKQTYQSWISTLVRQYGGMWSLFQRHNMRTVANLFTKVDGLRLDSTKDIQEDFFSGFVSAAGVFTIGGS